MAELHISRVNCNLVVPEFINLSNYYYFFFLRKKKCKIIKSVLTFFKEILFNKVLFL